MQARGEEVGDDHDPVYATRDQQIGSLFQAGMAKFEKGSLDMRIAACAREVGGRRRTAWLAGSIREPWAKTMIPVVTRY